MKTFRSVKDIFTFVFTNSQTKLLNRKFRLKVTDRSLTWNSVSINYNNEGPEGIRIPYTRGIILPWITV